MRVYSVAFSAVKAFSGAKAKAIARKAKVVHTYTCERSHGSMREERHKKERAKRKKDGFKGKNSKREKKRNNPGKGKERRNPLPPLLFSFALSFQSFY